MHPEPWTTEDILEATGGRLRSGVTGRGFSGICIDSRVITADELFLALKGEAYDGHDFIPDVLRRGIGGVIMAEPKADPSMLAELKQRGVVCVTVKETLKALGALAAFHRRRAKVSVIAVTGSNGKTTTREMTASILSQSASVLATSGNLNNEIGLPLTLLKLRPEHQWAVLELGMNHAGEIRRLAEICNPDIGIITNVGSAHLEGLGSIEGVMRAKGELLEKIKPEGAAVLNADDPRVLKLAAAWKGRRLLFGKSDRADVRAVSVSQKGRKTRFKIAVAGKDIAVSLNIPGKFMISNALAAAAAAHMAGFTAAEIRAGLEKARPVTGRMNIYSTRRGIHLIDDTYNANPDSMSAAIRTLQALAEGQRTALVAGDMLELGAHAEALHKKIGTVAAGLHISKIFFTGEYGKAVLAGARDQGMDPQDIYTGSREQIITRLAAWLQEGDWVLVKGSRAMGMEKIVQALKSRYDVPAPTP